MGLFGGFGGLLKNVFPKHTKVGKIFGSTREVGKGIIGGIFERKKSKTAAAKPKVSFAPSPAVIQPRQPLPPVQAPAVVPWYVWPAVGVAAIVGLVLALK